LYKYHLDFSHRNSYQICYLNSICHLHHELIPIIRLAIINGGKSIVDKLYEEHKNCNISKTLFICNDTRRLKDAFVNLYPHPNNISRFIYHWVFSCDEYLWSYHNYIKNEDLIYLYLDDREKFLEVIENNLQLIKIDLTIHIMNMLDFEVLDTLFYLQCFEDEEIKINIPIHPKIIEIIVEHSKTYFGKKFFSLLTTNHFNCISENYLKEHKWLLIYLSPYDCDTIEKLIKITNKIPSYWDKWKINYGLSWACNNNILIKSAPIDNIYRLEPLIKDNRSICCICFEECEYKLSCNHYFHEECFKEWNRNCSMCLQLINYFVVKN
jgi:hypothetical protein